MIRPSFRNAFSLIEMLAVVMILAIASAVILPQIGSHDDIKLSAASRELTADLLYVQNRAVSTGKTLYVVFDVSTGTYEAMESIEPRKTLVHPTSHEPFRVSVGADALGGTSIRSADFDGQTVLAFDALGTPYQYSFSSRVLSPMKEGSIVLACGPQTITVTIAPFTGVVKVK